MFARATDILGATNDSSLVVITNKQPGFVKLDSPQSGPGSFTMTILGDPGQVYNVQASTNFSDWTSIGTVTNVTGSVQYTDSVPANTPRRYYRAKVTQ